MYGHIWNERPRIFQNANFLAEIEIPHIWD